MALHTVGLVTAAALGGGCQDGGLGPPDSFVLLAPAAPPIASAAGLPLLRKLELDEPSAQPYAQLLAAGFGTEMMGSVYLAQRLARSAGAGGDPLSEQTRLSAALPIALTVGGASEPPVGRGLALPRTFGAPVEHGAALWASLPAADADERERLPTLVDRLARITARLAATAGRWDRGPTAADAGAAGPVELGYAIAMEVIAREWKPGRGPRGASFGAAATTAIRERFADVRENRYVLAPGGAGLKPAAALLRDAGVIATLIHRMAQTKSLAGRPASAELYAPFVPAPMPKGVHPSAFLGTFRNFQAKLLTAWMRLSRSGKPPQDAADVVEMWAAQFPEEHAEAVRIFLVTTFGATVKTSGVSQRPEDATATIAALDALKTDVLAGRKGLRDAVGAAP